MKKSRPIARGVVVRGVGQLKSWLPGKAEAGRDTPLSSRAIGRPADPPYTTPAPGRGEGHSQMGCAVTLAEAETEKRVCVMEGPVPAALVDIALTAR